MPRTNFPRDRFDDVPRATSRVGAHRAPRARNGWVATLLWWLLSVAVLTVIGIVVFTLLSRNETIPMPEPGGAQTEETEEPQSVVDTSYTVVVLNGTADEAAAQETQDRVISAGWDESEVISFPVEQADVDATRVFYVDERDELAARGLADLLAVEEIVHSGEFAEWSDGGLTVLVGSDGVTAP